jgi:thiosulfate/3-mercaptopyruvate sulfurtransferase
MSAVQSSPVAGWDEPEPLAPRGTLVLVPGRGENPGVYQRFGARLAFDAYRVRAVPDPTRDPDGVRDLVRDLLGDPATAAPRVLVGSDAGAQFALWLVATGQVEADALVLAGLPAPAAAPAVAVTSALTSALTWDEELEARTACPTHRGRLDADPALERGALARAVPPAWFDGADLSRVAIPVLGLHGEADTVSPLPAARERYRAGRHATLVTIAGGRHDALNDATHRTAAASVVLFLERLRLGAALPAIATTEVFDRPVLIGPGELAAALDGPRPPLLLDVRWALGDPDGRRHYRAGHLPGAVYADLDTELAGPPAPGQGRHPLPEIGRLQESARGWGLTEGRPVVVYDANGGQSAARAWWLLRWAGVADVRILDGALAGWTAAGLPLEAGDVRPEPGDVVLSAGHLPVLTADEAAALPGSGVLLDARAPQRYRGEVEPVDPRAGHIPGALNAPTSANLDAGGRFLSPQQLREHYAALGATTGRRVGVYCGSGVTAAHDIAALAVAGIDAALYPGSWSAWSSDPQRPVATEPAAHIPEGANR